MRGRLIDVGRTLLPAPHEDFAGRILPFDMDSACAFSQIAARMGREGKPVTEFDAQISAMASIHSAVVATRNVGEH
jgi:toxin FitB